MLPTRITVLRIEAFIAAAAVGSALAHDVPLPAQRLLTFKAAEVAHVPVSALGLCAFICKDYLAGWERAQRVRGLGKNYNALIPLCGSININQVFTRYVTAGTNTFE